MGINVPEMGHGQRASVFGPVSGSLSYSQWAKQNAVMQSEDGGLRDLPPSPAPRSPGAMPVRVAPLKGRGLSVR